MRWAGPATHFHIPGEPAARGVAIGAVVEVAGFIILALDVVGFLGGLIAGEDGIDKGIGRGLRGLGDLRRGGGLGCGVLSRRGRGSCHVGGSGLAAAWGQRADQEGEGRR